MERGSRWVWLLIGVTGGLIVLIKALGVGAEGLWYASEGYGSVFLKVISYRVVMFVVFFLWFLLLVYGPFVWATRVAEKVPMPLRARIFQEAEKALTDVAVNRWGLLMALGLSVIAGLIASSRWMYLLLFQYGDSIGQREPIFGHDAGFYMFRLPLIKFWLTATLLGAAVGIIGMVVRLRYEQLLRYEDNQLEAPPFVARGLLIVASVFLLLLALSQWISRYGILFSKRGVVFGAGFSDVYGTLPGIYLTVLGCVGFAVWFLIRLKSPDLTVINRAATILFFLWLAGRILLPAGLQAFVVAPNERDREKTFLSYNIQATRFAYGLDRIEERVHPARPEFSLKDLQVHKTALMSARLWDIEQLQGLFSQLQAFRPYYSFSLPDYDRYPVGSTMRQVGVAARELLLPASFKTWVNEHLRYTHGYGLAMVTVTDFTKEGMPVFLVKDIPSWQSPELGVAIRRPQIYFGEFTTYREPMQRPAPVRPAPPFPGRGTVPAGGEGSAPPQQQEGAPPQPGPQSSQQQGPARQEQGTTNLTVAEYVLVRTSEREFDYPIGDKFRETVYEAEAGVPIGNWWQRLLFAARFMDLGILLTTTIREETRLLMYRRVLDRVQTLAPFAPYLVVDPDAYPVIRDDGRIFWILDIYTTSPDFPYSAPVPDPRRRLRLNYIRTSAKATIDAYTGKTDFYLMDDKDPLIQALVRALPALLKRFEEMPDDLKRHIRYPRLIFYIQALLNAYYHMTDPTQFYNKEDVWEIPFENRMGESQPMLPYYILTRSPGEERSRFLLLLPFTPLGTPNLVAWMVAHCDPDRYGQILVYRFPKDRTVFGPRHIEARINADTTISAQLTLWNQQGSRVQWGNLLVLPMGQSLVYVRPLYLRSADTPLPQLKQVVVASANGLIMGDSILDAAERLVRASPDGRELVRTAQSNDRPGLAALAAELEGALQRSRLAREKGDWQTFGQEWERAERLAHQLSRRLMKEDRGDRPSTTP